LILQLKYVNIYLPSKNGRISEVGNKARLFRSSMSGFNKEDVNNYIIDVNREFSAKEDEYKAEIVLLKKKLEEADAKIAEADGMRNAFEELNSKLVTVEQDLETEKIARSEAEENLRVANCMIDELKAALDETVAALEEAKNPSESVINELAPETTDGLDTLETDTDKARLYDELRENIGDIMLNATKNADEIIKEAEKKASAIAGTSREKAEAVKRKLTVVTGRTIASLKRNAILNADNCVREFRTYTDDIAHSSKAMANNLEKKYAELSSRMEALGAELEEGIKIVLRDFDKSCGGIKAGLYTDSDK